MQHFTTTNRNLTITRLSTEESFDWSLDTAESNPWFRASVRAEAARFAESKGRRHFHIEAETRRDGILFDSETAERALLSNASGLLEAAKGILVQLRAEFGPHFETVELEAAIAKAEGI
jgi:hypothetical protein